MSQDPPLTCQPPATSCVPPIPDIQPSVVHPSLQLPPFDVPESTVEPYAALKGHVGSLVRVHRVHSQNIILSTADDRTARVWRIPERSKQETTMVALPSLTLWGHEARVWDIALVGKCVNLSWSACKWKPENSNPPREILWICCKPLTHSCGRLFLKCQVLLCNSIVSSVTVYMRHPMFVTTAKSTAFEKLLQEQQMPSPTST
jgi:hypothetical protein